MNGLLRSKHHRFAPFRPDPEGGIVEHGATASKTGSALVSMLMLGQTQAVVPPTEYIAAHQSLATEGRQPAGVRDGLELLRPRYRAWFTGAAHVPSPQA